MIESGTQIGKYRIIEKIGSGGMADVYKAEDTQMKRLVAMKVLPPEFARDPERTGRFEKEVRNLAALSHPHIVTVYDVGELDGMHYYTMALLPGGDLKQRIGEGLGPAQALDILAKMARALAYAHGKKLVHRDIKPENILFDEHGEPVLTDLGIARAIDQGTQLTRTGMSIGTPHYMSPEQIKGDDLDGRTDMYSLGAVFYEMLTGTVPYEAKDSFAVAYKHLNDPVPVLPQGYEAYQPLLERLMAKTPEERFATCDVLVQALKTLGGGRGAGKGLSPKTTLVLPSMKAPKRRPLWPRTSKGRQSAIIGTMVCILVVGLVYGLFIKAPFKGLAPVETQETVLQGEPPHATPGPPTESTPNEAVEPQGWGMLHITSTPGGATVMLDGSAKGKTPVKLSHVPAGSRRLVLQYPYYRKHIESVVIQPDTVMTRDIELQPGSGSLTVQTDPADAQVLLDDKLLPGKGPLTLATVPAGGHHLRARKSGYKDAVASVRIATDASVTVTLKLTENSAGRLYVTTDPPDAAVRILNITPPFEQGMSLKAGRYEIEASAANHQTRTLWIDLAENEDKTVSMKLEKSEVRPGDIWRDPATGMEFVWVPPGCFRMGCVSGSDACYEDEKKVREVCLDGFWLGKYEVTNAQYREFVPGHDSIDYEGHSLNGGDQPVVYVNWNEARAFARWMSRGDDGRYEFRLPTEAEWEYAARAGTQTVRYWGDKADDACTYANVADQSARRLWPHWTTHDCDDGFAVSAPVGRFKPNAFGLYDMLGNVREWCEDAYTAEGDDTRRVLRGGSMNFAPRGVRSADRRGLAPGGRDFGVGFRLVRNP